MQWRSQCHYLVPVETVKNQQSSGVVREKEQTLTARSSAGAISNIMVLELSKSNSNSRSSTCSSTSQTNNLSSERASIEAPQQISLEPNRNICTTKLAAALQLSETEQQYDTANIEDLHRQLLSRNSNTVYITTQKHQNQYRHGTTHSAPNNYDSESASTFQNIATRHATHVSGRNNTILEQYRLQQLYNYALSIERLRCQPPYSAAAAMAAAAAYSPNNRNGVVIGSRYQTQPSGGINYNLSLANSGTTSLSGGGQRLALSMSMFPQRIFQSEDPKPQHSYIGLIAMAILSSAESKLVLSDIYQYILDNYPYFRTRGPGWRNSIRHNLSLNDCFIKSGRSANGKGHYWAIHPANMNDFRKGDFRRRKAQRKVRKHMGLSVDDTGTDSPSPPPLDLTATPPPATGSLIPDQQLISVASDVPHQLTAAQQLAAAAHTHAAAFGYLLQQQNQQHVGLTVLQHHHQHQQQHQHIVAFPTIAENLLSPCETAQQHQSAYFQHSPKSQSIDDYNNPANFAQNFHSTSHNNHNGQSREGNAGNLGNPSNSTAASVIANIYSQTRKRQFDVASLLAPDVKLDIVNDLEATTTTTTTTLQQHTVITKLSVQHQQLPVQPHQVPSMHQHVLLDLPDDQEDIVDVEELLSGDELIEDELAEGEQLEEDEEVEEHTVNEQQENGNNERTKGVQKSFNTTKFSPSINTIIQLPQPVSHGARNLKSVCFPNYLRKYDTDTAVAATLPDLPHELAQTSPLTTSATPHHIFGSYYGTYMQAARHSGSRSLYSPTLQSSSQEQQ